MIKLRKHLPLILISLLLLTGSILWTNAVSRENIYTKISKNLRLIGEIFKTVSSNYVDEVDSEEFLRAGINGMLNTLDPYTNLIEKEEGKHRLQVITNGNYGGVGILLTFRNNLITVEEPPFPGTPAARAGIREGDIIVKVDGVPTEELGFDTTAQRIRGPVGTEVTLTIRREGEPKLLEFTLIRAQIKVEDVRYSGTIDEKIGYIQLSGFSKNAHIDLAREIQNLKRREVRGLILDLRSNPGGLLDAAVRVSDLFLPKNRIIVSTKGRSKRSNHVFKSINDPIYGDGPLIVLVNNLSASASEIVAGAIQDNDRGIVIGDTTFGKGLVQTVVPLSPSTFLKITTAKYFTPSGRCIQSRTYSRWENKSKREKDNRLFHTLSGRPVIGGDGIVPDIVITSPFVSNILIDLTRKSMFFNFAVHYAASSKTPPDSSLKITDEILNSFYQYLKSRSYEYHHPIEQSLSVLEREIEKEGCEKNLINEIERLKKSINSIEKQIMVKNSDMIKRILRRELASKYFGTNRGIEVSLEEDPVVREAVRLIKDKKSYNEILTVR